MIEKGFVTCKNDRFDIIYIKDIKDFFGELVKEEANKKLEMDAIRRKLIRSGDRTRARDSRYAKLR